MKTKRQKWMLAAALALGLMLLFGCAAAEEAADLTESCKAAASRSEHGSAKQFTDGKYTTYWESQDTRNPWITISSEQPMYGVYLCFQKMPDEYVIQQEKGKDNWETVIEGDTRFYHMYYPLDGLKKIRVLGDNDGKKTVMGFNEVFVFGQGEVPEWVQRWEDPVEKADILFLAAHPDDELLFMGGAIPTYAVEKGRGTVVAYLSWSNTTRRSEALNGLWTMGIRQYPVFLGIRDAYSSDAKTAYSRANGGKKEVQALITALFRQYKPEVVVTHDLNGEYGHGQHKMAADAAIACYDLAANPESDPESAAEWGTWQVKKLYLHLYGDEEKQTRFSWDVPLTAAGGKTGTELAEEAYAKHVTQAGHGQTIRGKKYIFSVALYGGELFPNTRFGLYRSEVGEDELHDDFLEHIALSAPAEATEESETAAADTAEVPAETETAETAAEPAEVTEAATEETPAEPGTEEAAAETEEAPAETVTEETAAEPAETTETVTEEAPVQTSEGRTFSDVTAPEWADVTLNSRGFLDEGEYVFEDEENGHWMYVDKTLRVQIVRSWEEPEKKLKSDKKQSFFCYTADIWCDIENGELPMNVWADPENTGKNPKSIHTIALENKLVYAVSADYYQYRVGQKSAKKSYSVGIEIRGGEIRWDDPNKKPPGMPTYETLALFRDGHVESAPSMDRGAEDYQKAGAWQVYTFGPCLIKDGVFTEQVAKANRVLNPRHAFGMVEPGHYVDVICEGRLKKIDGSTGVMMETLAQIMMDRGCQVAVNLDGGETAVCAFMGKKLNLVVDPNSLKLINGRTQVEALAFGVSDLVGE